MKMKQLEAAGLKAVRQLRKNKLAQGHPFMINQNTLPDGQCYLEFPDGAIKLVFLDKPQQDFAVIKVLSAKERASLRKSLRLS
jgi:hypothetical protein